MAQISRRAVVLGALLESFWAPSELLAQFTLRPRGSAVCAADADFAVTSRAAKAVFCFACSLMMIKLSRVSQFVLYRASRNLELAVDRIEHIADAC